MLDLIKVFRIYFKKYKVFFLIFILGFATLSAYNVASFNTQVGVGVKQYLVNKENNYNLQDKILAKNVRKTEENNFEKITMTSYKEKVDRNLFNAMLSDYSTSLYTNVVIYVPKDSVYTKAKKDIYMPSVSSLENNFSKEQLANKNKLDEYKNVVRESYKDASIGEKFLKDNPDFNKIFPTHITDSHRMLNYLLGENIYNAEEGLRISNSSFSYVINLGYYLLLIATGLIIFSLEYHTNFGKFISQLPISRGKIFFGKVLVATCVVFFEYLATTFAALWQFKIGLLGDLVTTNDVFLANTRTFVLAFSLVLLAAIFSSFCGSVISTLAMYIPALLLSAYAFIIVALGYVMPLEKIKSERELTNAINEKFNTLLTGDNPLFVPGRLFVEGYFDNKYIGMFYVVLVALLILGSYVYKKRSVEDEGKFYTNKTLNIIFYLLASFGITALGTQFILTFEINSLISILVSHIIVFPLMYVIFKIKLRLQSI